MSDRANIDEAEYARRRRAMVVEQIESRGVRDPRVLEAFLKVPRHLFVDPDLRDRAYHDYPLAIGEGQTISQPYTVAFMTEALKLQADDRVLEVGSGCGYQTAILLEIVKKVYCVERLAPLAELAVDNLSKLGYKNYEIVVGDGSIGLADRAPFDAIVVAAASPGVPKSLKQQLPIGGRLVIPVGDRISQSIVRVRKVGEDKFVEEDLGAFRFVSLVGAEGWDSE